MNNSQRKPSCRVSLIPFCVLILTLFFVIRFFGGDALGGASQAALLLAAGVAVAIAMLAYKVKWQTLEKAVTENIRTIGVAMIILLLIGAISGSWMVSGVVPTLICYGIKVITPKIFLFATCLICALVSVMTGSSWTTIATLGVALIGIGTAEGYSPGWTAGAIISGAYFGDKISPLSDTTVLASSSSGTPLFEHIKYMMITTVPSFSIALIIFLLVSIFHSSEAPVQAEEFSDALKSSFVISPWLLVVPVLTGILVARKIPALLTLFLSAITAGIAALIVQPGLVSSIGGGDLVGGLSFEEGFKGLIVIFSDSTSVETGNDALNELVSTSGMHGMLNTIFLIICAASFGGILAGSGMIQSITDALVKRVKSRTGLVSATVTTGFASNMLTGDQYLSIILTSSLYKKLFKDGGFESRLLSRSIEDSATVTSVLIPWNSCGMTQSTVLKVSTLEYLPYCFFNILSPLMSITIAAVGFRIFRHQTTSSDIM